VLPARTESVCGSEALANQHTKRPLPIARRQDLAMGDEGHRTLLLGLLRQELVCDSPSELVVDPGLVESAKYSRTPPP
jgi:hypothetical protein